jgi:hypothetical protein
MDPLMIAGDFREAINQILRDFQPITDPQFLPDQRAERFRGFDHAHCDPPLMIVPTSGAARQGSSRAIGSGQIAA